MSKFLRPPRRRWWQVLLRVGALTAAALVLLYATLPWWVPKGLLSKRLALKLSSQLEVPVTIEGMEMSWPEGLSLKGVRIYSPADFGGGEMIYIGRAQCELAPVAMLLGQPLGWVELTDAVVHAKVNDSGGVNVARLRPLMDAPPPLRLSVRGAVATLQLPRHDRRLKLEVSDLQYSAGRLKSLGQITMSARLAQAGPPAPVTLLGSVAAGGSVGPNVSTSFRFSGVDIDQLQLPALLGLPLKRLNGLGSGQLDCEIGEQSVVEKFRCSLVVRDLDAQPRMGPALPIIERAELTVGGNYDLVNEVMRADSFRLRLPGVDLTGKGDVHAAVFTGGWAGVHSLDVTGTVNPAMFAALLTGGSASLPGGLTIDGDVALHVWLDNRTSHLSGGVVLDATAAGLGADNRLLKPAGRALSAEFQGSVRLGGVWQFTADQTELRIGDNRFVGNGAMQNIRRALSRWFEATGSQTPAVLLECLAGLDWNGSFRIIELASLTELLGIPAAEAVYLAGPVDGLWSVRHADASLLQGSLRLPRQTQLRVGKWFVKPPGTEMRVQLSAEVPPAVRELRDIVLRVTAGSAELLVERGRAAFSVAGTGDRESMRVWADGRYQLRGAAGLLGCLPPAAKWAEGLDGAATGQFRVLLGGDRRRIHVHANATQIELDLGETFAKAAGQPADVLVDFRTDDALPPALRNCLELRLQLGSATASARAYFPPADEGARTVRCRGELRVTEADWLLKRTAVLARALEQWDLRGGMEATVRANFGPDGWDGQLSCDADDLQFRLPGRRGLKLRGSALRLRVGGRGGPGQAAVHFAADVGRSSLSATGTISLAKLQKLPPPPVGWPPPGVAGVDMMLRGRLVPDRAARSLLPELAEHLSRWGVGGALRAEGHLTGNADAINLAGSVDATELSLAAEGKLHKPAGVPAAASFEVTVPADLTEVQVHELLLETPPAQVCASGSVRFRPGIELAGRIAVNVPQLRDLGRYLPRLAPYRPAGGAFVEADLCRADGKNTIRSATIWTRDVTATVADKACRLDGELLVEELIPAGRSASIGRIASDSLEWAVGRSHGFLIVDVKNLAAGPAGRFDLLCTELDIRELQTWLGSADPAKGKLSQVQQQALTRRAEKAITNLKELLANAEISGRIKADRAGYFDRSVQATYELKSLVANVDANAGRVGASIRAGLNGGQVNQIYKLDLNEPRPRVRLQAELRDVAPLENIQIQLTRDFPGNTVHGSFSRQEEVTYSLIDFVMNSMDPRHRLIATGWAKTVTTDGVLQGRAAPKFITKIFPGLNLASYRYRVMTAFADLLPDGTAANDMLFSGVAYDIYMNGTTDSNNIARYSTGVLLLPVPASPEIAHGLRQGRIPIFNFKARIEGGKFYDQQVWYPLPTETAYTIFLKNNLLLRIWEAARAKKGARVITPQAADGPAGSAAQDSGK